jgi:transcriptional regulator with XRE-family HTH domain
MTNTKLKPANHVNHAGACVRHARASLGHTQETFAEVCGISVRSLSALESGERTNFSARILARLEQGLGWPGGTITQLVADPDSAPPPPGGIAGRRTRPPVYDRSPVPVDVTVIERSVDDLTELRRTCAGKAATPAAAALAALCRPYFLRLLEDNFVPGQGVHSAVRSDHATFAVLADWAAPHDPNRDYVQWMLRNTGTAADAHSLYMRRWSESRQAARRRSA